MVHKMSIIGYGGMGESHSKAIAKNIDGIVVKGIYDIRKEAIKKAESSGLAIYGSLDELLNDGDTDLVLISTPNDSHKEYAISCLKSGKNVICEKPATLNAAELAEIIALSKETGKLFTVHQNRRWDSDFLTMKRILADGLLSEPYLIESRVQGSRQVLHGWRGYKLNGGGMVLDWGVHLLDQLLTLIDEPVVLVDAHLHSIFTKEVDDNFIAMIRFKSGITAIVEVSMNCFIPQPRWHMCCKDGTAVIENWELDGKIVKLDSDNGLDWDETIVYTAAGPTRSMAPRPKETTKEFKLPQIKPVKNRFYKNIIAALDENEELEVKPAEVLRVMRVIDKIFESQESGTGLACLI